MSDIRTVWIDLAGDYRVEGPGLEEDDGLETAVVLSLFSDRRANRDDALPDNSTERRGWWGDGFAEVAGDRFGSRLWLLSREKQTSEVLQRAREYAREALAWLVQDGIAREVIVTAEVVRQGVLGLGIEIRRGDAAAVRYRFDSFWNPTHAA
jgi:phage gp46-like protein